MYMNVSSGRVPKFLPHALTDPGHKYKTLQFLRESKTPHQKVSHSSKKFIILNLFDDEA